MKPPDLIRLSHEAFADFSRPKLFHQLHCLDLVCQGVYRKVYEGKGKVILAFDGPEYLVMMHTGNASRPFSLQRT